MEQFMTTVGYPFLAALITGLTGLGMAFMYQRLGIQAQGTANTAVQNAVANFAGKIALDVAAGKVTLASVKNGAATAALVQYAQETVGDSLELLKVTPDTLATMLVGKLGAVVGVDAPKPVAAPLVTGA